jgi:hypothetical protein
MDDLVKKTKTEYEVRIKGELITLPLDSKMTENKRTASIRYGTPNKYLEFIQGGEIVLVDMGTRRVLAEDEEGLDISEEFAVAWSDPVEEEESAPAPMPMPAPAPAAPLKKEGVLKRMLESVKKRAKKDAEKHAKEVKKEADDVEKAVKDVQDKLKDLEKACSTGLKGGSRVNRKTRRSKGKRRYTKRR